MRATEFAYADTLVKRWSPAWDVPAGETDRVKAAFREPGCVEAAVGYYRAQKLRVTGTLAKPVTVPAVSFAGETDIIAPRAYEKARGCFTASYEVVQMPGGHFMHREHPEKFTTELVRILRDHAPVTAPPRDS
jgi:pimeloyl-ACP methyl ester carboxylesterase